ncbi:MAG: hypothetical protein ACE5F9_09595 [Phycisphaerae bacterium]
MKRVVLTELVAAACLVGQCGTASLLEPPSAQSLITDDLRRACPSIDDDFIVTLIVTARADRDAGFTKSEAILSAITGCSTGCAEACAADPDCDFNSEVACRVECANCLTAVVDLVFP